MSNILTKLVAVLSVFSLLAIGALLVTSPTTAAASPDVEALPDIGRVTVSGPDILVDGEKPAEPFFGVVDSTALAFAIENYINGNKGVAGWTSVFNGPDTGARMPVTPNDTPDAFWNQYFAQMAALDYNLVRIGPHDYWGTELSYNAWNDHQDQFYELLHSMCYYAQYHGVWLSFSMGGSQQYPAFHFNGGGDVFVPGSQAFDNYITYVNDIMVELENWDSVAMYDVFNEPDHNIVHASYWNSNGGKQAFNDWANAIADATAGVSTHPRNMGVAGFGNMFGMNQEDFNLSTGDTRFEILHRHYYGSNTDPYNFEAPEQWADEVGKPLIWGELADNGPYPLVRYAFAEEAIWNAGGQAITSMVATGTPGYPYSGGVSSDAPVPRTVQTPPAPEEAPAPVEDRPMAGPVNYSGPVEIVAKDLGDHTYSFHYTSGLPTTAVNETKWDLGDGNTSVMFAPVHTYAVGTYNVTLSLVDGDGNVHNATYLLEVPDTSAEFEPYVPTAGMIGAGGGSLTAVVAALLFGSVIGLLGYVAMRKRNML